MALKFSKGDYIELVTKTGKYKGTVMPSSDEEVVLLKLDNGYNMGVKMSTVTKSKKLKSTTPVKFPSVTLKKNSKLPNITLITTGGTIMSKVDYKTGANSWLTKPEELLAQIPELSEIANLKIISPFSMASEDMNYTHWQKLAKLAAIELNKKEISGVIITHGTDTLHFTSAALSFMLKKLNKPIALVAGQRSSDRGSFDGAQNLICAVHYCLSNMAEIAIVMHESTEDKNCIAIRGTKVRKMSTSRRDAFRPINELPLSRINVEGNIEILNNNFNKRHNEKVIENLKLNEKVALIKFAPGMDSSVINFYVKNRYKGIILEGTGFGHVSTESNWLPTVKKAVKAGVIVCMTSQCLYGRVDPYVYSPLVRLHEAGVIYLEDTLPEVAYVKLMWCLANSKDVKKDMTANLVGEINSRIEEKSFLY